MGAWALGPLHSYNDLVAGAGSPGFRDGEFFDALFNYPVGLAINPDATQLFVSDQGNNRIRVIDIGNANRVTTLAGFGKPGLEDGPFSTARFRGPSLLAYLPSGKIVVDDTWNNRLRLLDLEKKSVSTLYDYTDPKDRNPNLILGLPGSVWSMVYFPPRNALYFSQPAMGVLKKLDLVNHEVSTVLQNNPLIPHPGALATDGENLYVADEYLSQVYELAPKGQFKKDDDQSFNCRPRGKVQSALSMAFHGKRLYVLQRNPNRPLVRLLPTEKPVSLVSVEGDSIPPTLAPYYPNWLGYIPLQMVADPTTEGKFYVPQSSQNIVTAFRDMPLMFKNDDSIPESLSAFDLDYPETKPPKTYRILLVGDSHSFLFDKQNAPPNSIKTNDRLLLLPKRLELTLNTMAALDEVPMRYEVLFVGKIYVYPLNLWPYYLVPDLVRKYDIDLVLLLPATQTLYATWVSYFDRPLTLEQIPAENPDPEFSLKPGKDKIPEGTPKKFFELCKAKKLAKIGTNEQFEYGDEEKMMEDPAIRECMVDMYSRPLNLLKLKLAAMKTSQGKPVGFEMGLIPRVNDLAPEAFDRFWEEEEAQTQIPTIDFTKFARAYHINLGPFPKSDPLGHFSPDQHIYFGLLLAHEFIQQKVIPYPSSPGN